MESVLRRLKLIKPNSKEDEARKQLLKELFAYKKGLVHGFPPKPSAIAYDPKLSFLAIGTETGSLRVYGRPGVQFAAQHSNGSAIEKIFFLEEQARLITVSSDKSIHKWEMNVIGGEGTPSLTSVASFLPSESEKIEKLITCLSSNSVDLLLASNLSGSSSDDIQILDVESFQLKEERVIKKEDIFKIASEEQRSRGATIACLVQHPTVVEKFLIGYREGIMIEWNDKEKRSERCFGTNQQLEHASFNRSGSEVVTSHSDGSHMTWNTEDILKHVENATTPYGPFACKEITKIVVKSSSKDSKSSALTIFSGGMPKSDFGEKNTVTVMNQSKHVVYDLQTSKVVDFVVMCEAEEKEEGPADPKASDNPHTLLILTSSELLIVDLTSDDWPLQVCTTQVTHLHESPVSCLAHYGGISQNVWIKADFIRRRFSKVHHKEWPIKGGQVSAVEKEHPELLITGHENGDVVFWQATQLGLKKLFAWSTGDVFENSGKWCCDEALPQEAVLSDDSWPPFRKVTYSSSKYDDPRLTVSKISFCPDSGTLVVGGASGQVLVASLDNHDNKPLPGGAIFVDLLGKGPHPESLILKKVEEEGKEVDVGLLKVTGVLQVDGVHPCTDLALRSDWQLIGIGTSNGFLLFDLFKNKVITSKLTVSVGSRGSVSRSKSFQQSLRESFRNIKRKSVTPKSPEDTPSKALAAEKADETAAPAEEVKVEEMNGVKEDEKKEEKGETTDEKQQKENGDDDGNVKVVSQEIKEHKIEEISASKKSEVITTILTTNVSTTTTTTTTKKDGKEEVTEVKLEEESKQEESKDKKEGVANGNGLPEGDKKAEENGKEEKKSEEVRPEPPSRGSTLKREGVTFDVTSTPTRAGYGSSSSSVSCIRFINTCLTRSSSTVTPTMWVGLSDGKVFAYQLVVPQGTNRAEEDVTTVLAKEIHLKHGAPVCDLLVIDDKGKQVGGSPTPAATEGSNGQPAEGTTTTSVNHRLVVCSWEQIKIFSLPGLKAQTKHKLFKSRDEGRICLVSVQNFKSKSDENHSENALVCITSKGDLAIISLPSLKFQVNLPAIQLAPSDCDLIGQCCFFSNGVAAYRSSEEELTSFSLSTVYRALPQLTLPLKEGMRPVPPVPEEPAAAPEGEVVMEIKEGAPSPVHEPGKVELTGAAVGDVSMTTVTEVKEEKKELHAPSAPEAAAKAPTAAAEEVSDEEKKKPQDIIVDVKKYSTTTTTTTTIQNESSDANELLEDSIKCHLGEGDDDTVMVITSHDIVENKMTIKTTLHTITDPQGTSTETKTVVKETTSTCVESNFQDGKPVAGDGGEK